MGGGTTKKHEPKTISLTSTGVSHNNKGEKMKSRTMYPLVLAAAAAAMLFVSAPLRASDADVRIESSFKETYVYRTYLEDDAIRAEARNGVVTLTGTVVQESHKLLAQEAAANLPGVTRVDNQLVTKTGGDSDSADTWIGLKIKTTLLFHRNVSATKTAVEVNDGIVILKGEASSEAQKELTTEYARDIDGVKEVKNEMTVSNALAEPPERTTGEKAEDVGKKIGDKAEDVGRTIGEKAEDVGRTIGDKAEDVGKKIGEEIGDAGESIDDASITAQVKTALWIHRSTSSIHTKVKTRDGEVTLTGVAKNESEKALVTKLVTDIRGVTSVKNQMTVKESKIE